ncbi:MAG: S8 family serine peptidase [Candidatus Eremiobacteraeota bacterium]|nr:S8 family serine peptidase [Candidatus Eremiobacteraeota bacterium]MCW5867021.1 S8 family serine peptidase [Candidatus Eremiobacteraeota bacterium]
MKVQQINSVLQPRLKRPLDWKQGAADAVTVGVGSAAGAFFGTVAGAGAGVVGGAGAESMVASEMVLQRKDQLIARQAAVGAVAGLSAGLTTTLIHQTLGSLEPLVGMGVGLALGGAAAWLFPNRGKTALDSHWDNLESIQAPELWKQDITGQDVGVAVLDTGLSSHATLKGNIVAYRSFVDDKQDVHDDHFHGTAMAGIISGLGKEQNYPAVAPNARLIGLKVADDKGALQPGKVAEAIRWAVENRERYNIQVLNMSFTGEEKDDPAQTAELVKAVEEASARGIIVVASAGNDGPAPSKMQAPASAPSAIAVASMESHTWTLSDFSHRSPAGEAHATVAAPGSGWLEPVTGGGYRVEGGTSHAAAALSGVIALWKQAKPELTPAQARQAIEQTSVKLNNEHPEAQGAGAVRAQAAWAWLQANR